MLLGATAGVVLVQALSILAASLLRSRENLLRRYLPFFVSLAVGVLLATAILHLLPEAVAQLGNRRGVWMLFGGTLLVLFASERLASTLADTPVEAPLAQRAEELHTTPSGHSHDAAVLAGDGRPANLILASSLHSLVDGAALATAFAAGSRIGWLTTLAIALHEVPHRTVDFAVLVHLRVTPARALRLVALAGLPALLGVAAVALFGLHRADRITWLLPVSAASFLYIATVNLMPQMQGVTTPRRVALEMLSLAAGVALVLATAGIAST